MKPVYKRILLKLSGEVLAGEKGVGIDFDYSFTVACKVHDFAFYNVALINS